MHLHKEQYKIRLICKGTENSCGVEELGARRNEEE
jgi:hypothetical protein